MSRHRVLLGILSLLSVLGAFAIAQNLPASNPRALRFAAQSIAALTGGNTISDVTLMGTVTWIAGSDIEKGTASLSALGQRESRVEFALTNGNRIEIRDAQTGTTRGKWIAPSGASGKLAFHNCQTDAVWFFPALSSLAPNSNIALSYIGDESLNGKSVHHIHSHALQAGTHLTSWVKELSGMDFYLDAATLRPSAIKFDAHPDNNALDKIPIEVDYSDYRSINGIVLPTHIQKYVQGTLIVDLFISSAEFNTGVILSTFSID
jgi:hypothetical protein